MAFNCGEFRMGVYLNDCHSGLSEDVGQISIFNTDNKARPQTCSTSHHICFLIFVLGYFHFLLRNWQQHWLLSVSPTTINTQDFCLSFRSLWWRTGTALWVDVLVIVCVCVYLSSFLFSLHRHEISGYCLSALAKCKLSGGCSKGYWSHTVLLSLSHLGSLVIFVPLSQFCASLKGHYDSALPRPPSTLPLSPSLSQFLSHTHTLLSFSSCACPSSHSHGSEETELPLVWTGTMIGDERRLCGGQKSRASSFVSLNHVLTLL